MRLRASDGLTQPASNNAQCPATPRKMAKAHCTYCIAREASAVTTEPSHKFLRCGKVRASLRWLITVDRANGGAVGMSAVLTISQDKG